MQIGREFLLKNNVDPAILDQVLENPYLDPASALGTAPGNVELKAKFFGGERSVKMLGNYVKYLADCINKGEKIDRNLAARLAELAEKNAEEAKNKTKPAETAPAEKNEPAVVATKPGKLDPSRLKPFEN